MEESPIPFPLDVIAIFIDAYVEPYVGTFGSIVVFFIMLGLPIAFLFLAIKKLLKQFGFLLHRIFPGNRICAWCGSKNIEFDSDEKGIPYWKKGNKDGSQDKRFKGNYQLASYTSIYKCLECNAKTEFGYVDGTNSHLNTVTSRTLLSNGKEERKGKNWDRFTNY